MVMKRRGIGRGCDLSSLLHDDEKKTHPRPLKDTLTRSVIKCTVGTSMHTNVSGYYCEDVLDVSLIVVDQ